MGFYLNKKHIESLEMDGKTNFIGYQVPKEVKFLCKNLKKISEENFQCLINANVAALHGHQSEFRDIVVDINPEIIQSFYPGIITIIKKIVRQSKLSKKKLINDLNELGLTGKHQEHLVKMYAEWKPTSSVNTQQQFQQMDDLRWRVDVAISTTTLNRALEPTVLMQLTTNKNENHTFEVSKQKFHELRHTVAEVLNNMQQLEKRKVFQFPA